MTRAGLAIVFVLVGCSSKQPGKPFVPPIQSAPSDAPLAAAVDPFIGTANDGQTFPGAVVPWGMASPSPHTTRTNLLTYLAKRSNSGYLSGEPRIYGFGETHLSGVGCPDFGAPVIVPTVGPIETDYESYGSAYTREAAHAGYYAVTLSGPNATVELTAAPRVGVHRIWFPARSGDANVLIDVGRSLSWREGAGHVHIVSDREVEGSVDVGLFCGATNQPTVFFVARFDHASVARGTWNSTGMSAAPDADGMAGAYFRYTTRDDDPIRADVGISFVSTDNARANLEAETQGKSFDELHLAAAHAWQDVLSRIEITGGSAAEHTRFYTALYHALLQPFVASDENGDHRTATGVAHDPGRDHYSVFSLWDTYRTVHPLLTLVYPEHQLDMLRSLGTLSNELGRPPKWELLGDEVNMMVGDPAAIVVNDSYRKGLTQFDAASLYAQIRAAATDPNQRPGVAHYMALGYVPMEDATNLWGPASTTLEYGLADANVARLAEALGQSADAPAFDARAAAYQKLYDSSTGLLRPRWANGNFLDPFDPDASEGSLMRPGSGGPGYVEGTAWNYAFFAPHDTPGLIALEGTNLFVTRLQNAFDTNRITFSNEPDIAFPYLFDYVPGESGRTAVAVRNAMDTSFGDGPTGLPGNDDTGTLSAWYVFSAMGIYPDAPGTPRYAIGSPLFDRIDITLSGPAFPAGGRFTIDAAGAASGNRCVASQSLDDKQLPTPFLQHSDVGAGRVLHLAMTNACPAGL